MYNTAEKQTMFTPAQSKVLTFLFKFYELAMSLTRRKKGRFKSQDHLVD